MHRKFAKFFACALLLATVLAIDASRCAADAPKPIELKAGEATLFPRDLPEKADLTGVYKIKDDDSFDLDRDVRAGANAGYSVADKKLSIATPGEYIVKFAVKQEDGSFKDTRQFLVSVVRPSDVVAPPAPAPAPAPVATTPSLLGVSGNSPDVNSLRNAFQVPPNEFKNIVITLAKSWRTLSGDQNAQDNVAYLDHNPIATCTSIAKILRDSAAELQTASDPAVVRTSMKARFQTLYASGDNEFSRTNPIKEDWQPFLQRLESDVDSKIKDKYAARATDKQFLVLVLTELADGFDQLANERRGTTAGSGSGVGMSGTSAQGSGGGYDDPCCRRRRRCRCSSLLWGR